MVRLPFSKKLAILGNILCRGKIFGITLKGMLGVVWVLINTDIVN